MSTLSQFLAPQALQSIRVCRKARQGASVLVFFCTMAQLLIDPDLVNSLSVLLVLIASVITFQVVLRASVVRIAPLPALVVLGFNFATMSGALIAQTFSLRAITFNLQVPILTFGGSALFQLSLLATLWIFLAPIGLRTASRTINRRVLKPMGLLRMPTSGQFWLMGLLGSCVLAWQSTLTSSGGVEYGDVGDKFLLGLSYFAYAPFLIPVTRFAFPAGERTRVINFWFLLAYTLAVIVIGVAANSRGTFAMGVANLGLAALILTLMGQLPINRKLRRWLTLGAFLLLAVMPLLSDLATAMVVVRSERGSVSSTELVTRTFVAFEDKSALQAYRNAAVVMSGGGYNETYLANPFLARFVETKFFDNTLALTDVRTGGHSAALWKITLDKTLALLPTPALHFMGVNVDKAKLDFSMGDALYDQQFRAGLGGYRVGSPLGHGLALMGAFTYIAVIPLFLVVFVVLQALTSVSNSFIVISPVILLQFMRVYFLADGDSLLGAVGLILRSLPQDILLYAAIFQLTQRATKSFVVRGPHIDRRTSWRTNNLIASGKAVELPR